MRRFATHVAKVMKETLEALGCPTQFDVFIRHCTFRLSFVPVDDSRTGTVAPHFLRRSSILGRFLDHLKRRGMFSTWNPYAI
ncbi:hypothetical protein TNCV_727131 [Trichonephila clavipes]|nr:hypothetical protein TNCV_727131 [Trichonephila clavipes]